MQNFPNYLIRLFLVWLVVWPLVILGLMSLEALLPDLPFVLQTMVLTAVLVPTIAIVVSPLAGYLVSRITSGKR
ncbi:hypothetical protein RE428_03790 [Marinobacter nanhaiticus D15-8W]|uniref:Uncharacterized protein n=1 Tax=Marinobacter nanhaiticus D15-8W TaxID=626887 RepID=N6X1H5_9GAMM|nr:hypothetical protein J057_06321 [Marinobacter nanhaiticus D15-8W]BES69361.1 hypothetical protein RE428_03790 [Marinobacter nanhaiticus D15-8W]